jgi:hypothetical protein
MTFAMPETALAVLGLFLGAQERGSGAKTSMAALIVLLAVAMGVGIAGATVGIWWPLLKVA